jgi:hypothetical protein
VERYAVDRRDVFRPATLTEQCTRITFVPLYDLRREFHMSKVIPMDDEKERLKIYVNQDLHEIDTQKISYERIVDLYLGEGGKPSKEYLVKYSHGPSANPTGTLAPAQEVEVKNDMRFRISGTGES